MNEATTEGIVRESSSEVRRTTKFTIKKSNMLNRANSYDGRSRVENANWYQ